jgi:hypothetical protein
MGPCCQLDVEENGRVVLLFDGNTTNFNTGALRFLPPVLTKLCFSCLAFNRPGHEILAICRIPRHRRRFFCPSTQAEAIGS